MDNDFNEEIKFFPVQDTFNFDNMEVKKINKKEDVKNGIFNKNRKAESGK